MGVCNKISFIINFIYFLFAIIHSFTIARRRSTKGNFTNVTSWTTGHVFDAEVPKNKITIVVVIQAGTNPCLYNIHAGASTVLFFKDYKSIYYTLYENILKVWDYIPSQRTEKWRVY